MLLNPKTPPGASVILKTILTHLSFPAEAVKTYLGSSFGQWRVWDQTRPPFLPLHRLAAARSLRSGETNLQGTEESGCLMKQNESPFSFEWRGERIRGMSTYIGQMWTTNCFRLTTIKMFMKSAQLLNKITSTALSHKKSRSWRN